MGWSGISEKQVKDLWGVGGHSNVWLSDIGVRLSPLLSVTLTALVIARKHQRHGVTASAMSEVCPHDRPLTARRYILRTSLLPAQGFSRRNLTSYPTSCPNPILYWEQDGHWAPCRWHSRRGRAGTHKQRNCMHAGALEALAGACRFPGSWLPRQTLAPSPPAGVCSYFRKPPGKGRAR